jgi:hypothetical protein
MLFCAFLISRAASGQTFNFNAGGGAGFPLGKVSDFANTSYNLVVGGGPNLAPHVKLVGEFMFHGLPLKQSVLDQAQIPIGKGRLYSLSGNLLVGTGNGKWGVYAIGGGGWYRRTVEAKEEQLGIGEICEPVLGLWAVECVNGIVSTSVTIASHTSSAPGFNIGGGFTHSLWESGVHFYTEVRYHHAFTSKIDTTVLPLTFGIRF